MNSATQHLRVAEKIGYALGDLAANLIFQTLVTFLAFFYTDVYRIPPSAAATLIFIVGLLGAFVFTPVMGLVADRTRTRWGKFRPWILWTAIPFGALSLLAFSTPDLGESGKIVYALTTYTLLVLVYVANNLPYSALSGVLTGSMAERNSLSSYRFVAVMFAQFFVQVFMLAIIESAGHGDKAAGIEKVMTWLAIIGIIMLLITFFTTKERIVPKPEQKSSLKEDLSDLVKNKPWVIMLSLTTLVSVS